MGCCGRASALHSSRHYNLQSCSSSYIRYVLEVEEIKKEKQKTAAAATAREAVESMNEYVSCCNSIQGTLPIFKLNWM